MNRFTTSAQKTLKIKKTVILAKLEDHLAKEKQIQFTNSSKPDLKAAELPDGSTLLIAAFDKEDGKTLAMIDHQNIPGENSRSGIQSGWRKTLDMLFSGK